MAYNEELATRVEEELVFSQIGDLTSRKMFGGIAFMINGNMAVGVMGQGGLMVRVSPEDYKHALAERGAHAMDVTGKPMKGFVVIDEEVVENGYELSEWVSAGADYAASLPPKKK